MGLSFLKKAVALLSIPCYCSNMSSEDVIVTTLKEIQESLKENDALFASRLGVDRSTWALVRAGRRRPGPRLLGGARVAFPKLERQIVDFLVGENVTKTTI